MTPEVVQPPEWVLAFRRKVWAQEARFLASERDAFLSLFHERQRQVEEAQQKSKGDK